MEEFIKMLHHATKGIKSKVHFVGINYNTKGKYEVHTVLESLKKLPGEIVVEDFNWEYFCAFKVIDNVKFFALISPDKARELKGLVPCPTCGKECVAHV